MSNEEFRPLTLDGYIGQDKIKQKLAPYIAEAKATVEPLPHIFLASGPGMGKTTLAKLVADAVGDPSMVLDLSKMTPRTLVRWARNFPEEGAVVLADELQMLSKAQQDGLLTLLEEGYISAPYGGIISIGWLTMIGATTDPQSIRPALMERFGLQLTFEPYTDEELALMVKGMAASVELEMPQEHIDALGRAAAGVPRLARNLVKAYRAVGYTGTPTVEKVLEIADVEMDGLTSEHMEYLRTLDRFNGEAGEKKLCSFLRMHESKLASLERLLFKRGYIDHTDRGRVMLPAGDRRLKGERVAVGRRRTG